MREDPEMEDPDDVAERQMNLDEKTIKPKGLFFTRKKPAPPPEEEEVFTQERYEQHLKDIRKEVIDGNS
jgi:hypothetical protein